MSHGRGPAMGFKINFAAFILCILLVSSHFLLIITDFPNADLGWMLGIFRCEHYPNLENHHLPTMGPHGRLTTLGKWDGMCLLPCSTGDDNKLKNFNIVVLSLNHHR